MANAFASPDSLEPAVVARSQLADGDFTRLRRVFDKARRGAAMTIGAIGGSITTGSLAHDPANAYFALVLEWWRIRFPKSTFKMVNAGVAGTGSLYGALRVEKDLLRNNPDFVIVEFAVNDTWTDQDPFEGLIRHIMLQPQNPAVMVLFMMFQGGSNAQDWQSRIAAHYGLPMVSFRDALWPEITAGRMPWAADMVDIVHPNDAGHRAAGRFVTTMLDRALADTSSLTSPLENLPAPLYSDRFQYAIWRDATMLHPLENRGWSLGHNENNAPILLAAPAWVGSQTNGRISFTWFGSGLVAMLLRPISDEGQVIFWVDGVLVHTVDKTAQPKRDIVVVVEALARGWHDVAIERVDDPARAPPKSKFGIFGLGILDRV